VYRAMKSQGALGRYSGVCVGGFSVGRRRRGGPTRLNNLSSMRSQRIGYSQMMNWFDPTKAHAVTRSVVLRDEAYAARDATGESIRVVGA
jgi:hypothetical protein